MFSVRHCEERSDAAVYVNAVEGLKAVEGLEFRVEGNYHYVAVSKERWGVFFGFPLLPIYAYTHLRPFSGPNT